MSIIAKKHSKYLQYKIFGIYGLIISVKKLNNSFYKYKFDKIVNFINSNFSYKY